MKQEKYSVRAVFDEETITVYQAYRPAIAIPAVENQKFVLPFKMDRMTWIKPSYLWMMYRSGWAKKEGQEHVLAIKIKRVGWEWARKNACLSHYVSDVHESYEDWQKQLKQAPVRIQWDPEKDIHLNKLVYKSIQVGLSAEAVDKYVNEWVVSIDDISDECRRIHALILDGKVDEAKLLLPEEKVYSTELPVHSE